MVQDRHQTERSSKNSLATVRMLYKDTTEEISLKRDLSHLCSAGCFNEVGHELVEYALPATSANVSVSSGVVDDSVNVDHE